MPEADLIQLFVEPLNKLQVRYLISGSVAAMLYGEPRVTHDIDLILHLRSDDLAGLPEVFPDSEFYLPPSEVISVEMAREQRGHFNVIHSTSGLKADCYIVNRDELHAWAFRHPRSYTVGDTTISVAPPEYVILRKLEYYREGRSEKHLRDIQSMLSISPEEIDQSVIKNWTTKLRLEAEWNEALGTQRSTPPSPIT